MAGAIRAGDGGLSPDEAFGVLGNEIRIQILQELGAADDPLSFTELRDRVGIRQGGQFNYHLEKVVGHFVAKTDDGYLLRQPGRRVVQAVLSGAVTEAPKVDYTEIDEACWWCEAPIVVRYDQERLDLYCTGCAGTYGDTGARRPTQMAETVEDRPADLGYLGAFFLPPAGVHGRTPAEAYRAGMAREIGEYMALSADICPRCSGAIRTSVQVCEEHDTSDGLCGSCGNRKAVHIHIKCRTCIYRNNGVFLFVLYGHPVVMAFVTAHGAAMLSPDADVHLFSILGAYEEEVLSTDPFRARFTFAADGESLAVTVGEDYSVVDTERF